jgi:DNA-binding LacI/PurR family transcriptional regulator
LFLMMYFVDSFFVFISMLCHMPNHRIADLRQVLRSKIANGAWPAGHRLPTRIELAEAHDVPATTVQEAIARLVADGSLITAKRGGTRVSDLPPERNLLFLAFSPEARRSLFGRALSEAAASVSRHSKSWRLEAVDAHDSDWRRRLADGALAGVLWLGAPPVSTPHSWVIQACFSDHPQQATPAAVLAIDLDNASFLAASMRLLAEEGCRRPGVLSTPGFLEATLPPSHDPHPELARRFSRHGLTLHPWLVALSPPSDRRFVTQIVRMLHALPTSRRPDGLIVCDDHLRASLAAACDHVDWRPRVVVALGNSRSPTHADGFRTVGFAAEDVIATAIELLTNPAAHQRRSVSAVHLDGT